MKKLGRFLFWFAAEFVVFALLVANGRAYVLGKYIPTVVTDGLILAFNFVLAKKFVNDKDNQDYWSMAGSVCGGMCGSCFSIYVTKVIYGA